MTKRRFIQQSFERSQGNRGKVPPKERFLSVCLKKHIKGEGQTFEEWDTLGLAGPLLDRIKHVSQLTVFEAKFQQHVKEYHKVAFPPESKFTHPKHISEDVTWAVMHLTPQSKAVVVGYIEDDIFYLIFLDKDHLFWPVAKK